MGKIAVLVETVSMGEIDPDTRLESDHVADKIANGLSELDQYRNHPSLDRICRDFSPTNDDTMTR